MLTMKINLIDGAATINGTPRTAPYSFVTSATGLDTIETTGQNATLQFDDDRSILRFDIDTKVKLVAGANADNTTIAQANLENGVLWGRVLTATGINFSYGGVVAGVRGTGIKFAVDKNTQKTTVALAQTQGTVALTCKNATKTLAIGQEKSFDANCGESTDITGLANLYAQDGFIAENVVKDIMYLNGLEESTFIKNEKEKTIPDETLITDTPTRNATQAALCSGYADANNNDKTAYYPMFANSTTYPVCDVPQAIAYLDFTKTTDKNKLAWECTNEY
jgi:hypothetical protein